ncbi:MAG: hypothetical protein JNM96_02925 [Bacteroidia bacterium]|nr:hypothetical protein [Bacteroidia bacterium]
MRADRAPYQDLCQAFNRRTNLFYWNDDRLLFFEVLSAIEFDNKIRFKVDSKIHQENFLMFAKELLDRDPTKLRAHTLKVLLTPTFKDIYPKEQGYYAQDNQYNHSATLRSFAENALSPIAPHVREELPVPVVRVLGADEFEITYPMECNAPGSKFDPETQTTKVVLKVERRKKIEPVNLRLGCDGKIFEHNIDIPPYNLDSGSIKNIFSRLASEKEIVDKLQKNGIEIFLLDKLPLTKEFIELEKKGYECKQNPKIIERKDLESLLSGRKEPVKALHIINVLVPASNIYELDCYSDKLIPKKFKILYQEKENSKKDSNQPIHMDEFFSMYNKLPEKIKPFLFFDSQLSQAWWVATEGRFYAGMYSSDKFLDRLGKLEEIYKIPKLSAESLKKQGFHIMNAEQAIGMPVPEGYYFPFSGADQIKLMEGQSKKEKLPIEKITNPPIDLLNYNIFNMNSSDGTLKDERYYLGPIINAAKLCHNSTATNLLSTEWLQEDPNGFLGSIASENFLVHFKNNVAITERGGIEFLVPLLNEKGMLWNHFVNRNSKEIKTFASIAYNYRRSVEDGIKRFTGVPLTDTLSSYLQAYATPTPSQGFDEMFEELVRFGIDKIEDKDRRREVIDVLLNFAAKNYLELKKPAEFAEKILSDKHYVHSVNLKEIMFHSRKNIDEKALKRIEALDPGLAFNLLPFANIPFEVGKNWRTIESLRHHFKTGSDINHALNYVIKYKIDKKKYEGMLDISLVSPIYRVLIAKPEDQMKMLRETSFDFWTYETLRLAEEVLSPEKQQLLLNLSFKGISRDNIYKITDFIFDGTEMQRKVLRTQLKTTNKMIQLESLFSNKFTLSTHTYDKLEKFNKDLSYYVREESWDSKREESKRANVNAQSLTKLQAIAGQLR